MNEFGNPVGFGGFISGMPPFFKLFGGAIFLFVIGMFLFIIVRGLKTWFSNNQAEVITTVCRIVDKRTKVWGGTGDTRTNTSYFITFEFEDGSRKEFRVRSKQFGLLVAGDMGDLTYQGSRFISFNRMNENND